MVYVLKKCWKPLKTLILYRMPTFFLDRTYPLKPSKKHQKPLQNGSLSLTKWLVVVPMNDHFLNIKNDITLWNHLKPLIYYKVAFPTPFFKLHFHSSVILWRVDPYHSVVEIGNGYSYKMKGSEETLLDSTECKNRLVQTSSNRRAKVSTKWFLGFHMVM